MLEPAKNGDQIKLVTDDGSQEIPLDDTVWGLLSDEEILLDDFKKVIQSYTLQNNRDWAMMLKEHCPTTDDYRQLRAKIRMFSASVK
jgi:hypothetical protein